MDRLRATPPEPRRPWRLAAAAVLWVLALAMLSSFVLLLAVPDPPPDRPRHGAGPPRPTATPAPTVPPAQRIGPSATLTGTVQGYALRVVTVRRAPHGPAHRGDPPYAVIVAPTTYVDPRCRGLPMLSPGTAVTVALPLGGNGALMALALAGPRCGG